MSPDLALALRLADAADAISLPHFRSGLEIETKADLTPVTEADRAVERELRGLLADERPHDAVLGEEQGAAGSERRRWILDPIDGTRNYARGIPVWATLIALEEDGVMALGVASAPGLARRGGRRALLGHRRRGPARRRDGRDVERAPARRAPRRRHEGLDRRSRLCGGRSAFVAQPSQDVVDVGDLLLEIPLTLFERLQELFAARSTPTAPTRVVMSFAHGHLLPEHDRGNR